MMRRAAAVIATSLLVVLTGCATTGRVAESAYVGVFTGQYVDGKPLYRFPPIHVIGSRSSGDTD